MKRVNSKEDRRSILVTITKKGKKMLEEYNDQIRVLADRISKITRDENLPSLVETLEKASA